MIKLQAYVRRYLTRIRIASITKTLFITSSNKMTSFQLETAQNLFSMNNSPDYDDKLIIIPKQQIINKNQWLNFNEELLNKFNEFQTMNKASSNTYSSSNQIYITYNNEKVNLYTYFPDFSKRQLDKYTQLFQKYDVAATNENIEKSNGKLNVDQLKMMMEELSFPLTTESE